MRVQFCVKIKIKPLKWIQACCLNIVFKLGVKLIIPKFRDLNLQIPRERYFVSVNFGQIVGIFTAFTAYRSLKITFESTFFPQ